MIATVETILSFLKKTIKGLLKIFIIIVIAYFSFINFNFSPDALESSKFQDAKKRDRQLHAKIEVIIKKLNSGQQEKALIEAENTAKQFPESIYAKRLVRQIKDSLNKEAIKKK